MDTPIQRALAAAEARSRLPPSEPAPSTSAEAHSSALAFNPSAADKLPFHRIIDTEVLPKCSKPQAVKTLDILLTITSNILDPPDPAIASKYRQIRLTNPGIARNVVEVPGAFDFLAACGFRKITTDFVPYLTFAASPSPKTLHLLRVGNYVLKGVAEKAREVEARDSRFKESEKDAQAARVATTMLAYEEDRRLKREKDARDKVVREARAKREADQVAAIVAMEHANDHPVIGGRTDASTMDVDESEEAPPSYGALHGRVLGTGEAVAVPSNVRFVSQQDEEYSDEEQ